jgi:hypothetical protein
VETSIVRSESTEQFLGWAIQFFGAERELDTIRVSDVRRCAVHLATMPARPVRQVGEPSGPPLKPATVRNHLNALSNCTVLWRMS